VRGHKKGVYEGKEGVGRFNLIKGIFGECPGEKEGTGGRWERESARNFGLSSTKGAWRRYDGALTSNGLWWSQRGASWEKAVGKESRSHRGGRRFRLEGRYQGEIERKKEGGKNILKDRAKYGPHGGGTERRTKRNTFQAETRKNQSVEI